VSYWDLRSAAEHPALAGGEPPPGLLSEAERRMLATLHAPKRRRDWLLGRYVAKALVRSWLARTGRDVPAALLTVAADADGAPQVFLAGDGSLPLTISISHRGPWALCALAPAAGAYLGADLELCEPRSAAFVADFFTQEEAALVDAVAATARARVVTEVWSAKEAALKALRLGLRADTRDVDVRPRLLRQPGWGRVAVAVDLPGGRGGATWARDEGAYVAAIAWLDGDCPPPSDELRGFPAITALAAPADDGLPRLAPVRVARLTQPARYKETA
jgi:4'-phosphopantetheinyl transferase